MNKLIIVGNGFDLAHGLPTSYQDFVDDFWKNLQYNLKKEITRKIVTVNCEHYNLFDFNTSEIKSFSDFVEHLNFYCADNNLTIDTEHLTVKDKNNTIIFSFENELFRLLSQSSITNWCTIEKKYYEILKSLVCEEKNCYQNDIQTLNKEFEDIKLLLQDYLKKNVVDAFDFADAPIGNEEILHFFNVKYQKLNANPDSELFLEFPPEDHEALIQDDKELTSKIGLRPHSLFLDFNYTPTASNYVKQINSLNEIHYGTASIIKIHGEVGSEDNPIKIGYGDEMDDDYKKIENAPDDYYIDNIKSFQYMRNSNYKKLINWIESGKFQVLIFGHSCGLSDRTLLNTIFENHNCRSIKIFYHKDDKADNYTELTHNLSKIFTKKEMMRSKVVDKAICVELPQTIRFNKKGKVHSEFIMTKILKSS